MKRHSATPPVHWWDWTSVVLLLLLLQTAAARLIATEWIPSLDLIRSFAWMGAIIGLAVGYSVFSSRRARWLSFFYMLFMLPLQWTVVIEGPVALAEKLSSVGGRLILSFSDLFARRPVEDPLFFLALMSVAFWVLSASAGYRLTRHQNFLTVTVPSMIGMLVIQSYDNGVRGRIWILAFFILLALLLLGQLTLLEQQKRWKEKRIFLSPENGLDLTSGMAIAAGLLIFTAWTISPSFIKIETARQAWSRITKPWTEFTQRFENAVSALDARGGGAASAEFYGTQLELGTGFSLSEAVMFTVETPELPASLKPPRYYWRGRVYDQFIDGRWTITGTQLEEFSPDAPLPFEWEEEFSTRFVFNVGEQPLSLLYAPAQAIWVSRPGSMVSVPGGSDDEVLSWSASPGLLPGETYQVEALLSNPNIEQLRAAGTAYPQWVVERYLQLPDDVSPRIRALAQEIASGADTPFDKASAITRYLRENIEYAPSLPEAPFNTDPLEWILFEHKQAYCVYYASIEIVMLRSLGIPARMAVGFAQGTGTSSRQDGFAEEVEGITVNTYTVRKQNAHAWPEVYFPGVGWVEFEPTGNQDPLDRPLAPRDSSSSSGLLIPDNVIPELDNESLRDQSLPDEELETPVVIVAPRSPLVYAIPILITLAALAAFLSRRYALPTRLPSILRASIERGGTETPGWILHWEHWVNLTSIERAFESVNFGLRQLKDPSPVHATPAERADKLASILPEAASSVKILLDEHQTSLYTSRTTDARQARRAALTLRFQVILARIRHFWTGKYSPRL